MPAGRAAAGGGAITGEEATAATGEAKVGEEPDVERGRVFMEMGVGVTAGGEIVFWRESIEGEDTRGGAAFGGKEAVDGEVDTGVLPQE